MFAVTVHLAWIVKMTMLQVVGGYKHRVSAVNWDNWLALLVWHGDLCATYCIVDCGSSVWGDM